jgi:hypothetical protein
MIVPDHNGGGVYGNQREKQIDKQVNNDGLAKSPSARMYA